MNGGEKKIDGDLMTTISRLHQQQQQQQCYKCQQFEVKDERIGSPMLSTTPKMIPYLPKQMLSNNNNNNNNSPLVSPRSRQLFGQADVIDEEDEMIFPITDISEENSRQKLNQTQQQQQPRCKSIGVNEDENDLAVDFDDDIDDDNQASKKDSRI
ncbi:hypothetical protein QR98_0088870 [Sarcoptes scabiei]|uniref:Uncharacterized protein n=1 Tax=Sarcoptes scabiei TaxID=52283 RepID=A0A132AHD4_SARSC|nr:hypothetical protein QR98_0088870 [Sarcoptes scabiei]